MTETEPKLDLTWIQNSFFRLAAEFTALAVLAEPQLIRKLEETIFHSCGVGGFLALGSSSADSLQFPVVSSVVGRCVLVTPRPLCDVASCCVSVCRSTLLFSVKRTFQCGTGGGGCVQVRTMLLWRRADLLQRMRRLSDSERYM